MADMRPWTRQDSIDRAYDTLNWFGYYWGGDGMYWGIQYVSLVNGVPTLGSGTLIACDCSAFCSWVWNIGTRLGSSEFQTNYPCRDMLPLSERNGEAEHDAPGIQPGDCFLNAGHHIALYVGNNTTVEMHTSDWANSTNGQGGSIRRWNSYGTKLEYYRQYVPFDSSYSEDYDSDDPEYNPDDGTPPPPPPKDDSDDTLKYLLRHYGLYYTKRYWLMKSWR